MRNGRKKNNRKLIASFLTGALVIQQATMLGAVGAVTSTNITGITGSNGVYNINPEDYINGSIGYRNYQNFQLKNGDIANLIYNSGISSFVNLVDNQIQIDGIVNTMKNNGFYNGKAIFVSPNGMVVGASGVLNVGSLGVYTPDSREYDKFKGSTNFIERYADGGIKYNQNGGAITIDGKVLSVGDVTLAGKAVNISSGGGIISGINQAQMKTDSTATALFNSIVNGTYSSGTEFVNSNGVITIKTAEPFGNYSTSAVGTNIKGNVYNIAKNGTVNIQNNTGDLNISGNIKNNGTTTILNGPGQTSIEMSGTGWAISDTSNGNTNTKLNITGNIDTTGELKVINYGDKGANVGGTINHQGQLLIQNGALAGTDTASRNPDIGELNINANITNTQGNTTINNYAGGGLNVSAGSINNQNGNLTLLNTGAGGLKTAGTISNKGVATVTNQAGNMTIGGTFSNEGNSTFLNDTGASAFTVNGTVNNTGAGSSLTMTNDGTGAFTTNSGSQINAYGLEMTNNGSEFVINGGIDSRSISRYTNNQGDFTIGGNITNNSDSYFENNGANFNIGGTIQNTSGTANFTNNGTGNMEFSGTVNNVGTTNVINSANSGKLIVGGNFTNNGVTAMTNYGEAFDVTGNITNKNHKLTMTNHKGAFTTAEGSQITTDGLRMENNGSALVINGNITNSTNGDYINNRGSFTTGANSNIQNKSGVANFENNGDGAMTFGGTVNNSGTTKVTNSDNSGLLTVGGNFTNDGVTTMVNEGAGFDVTGNITNKNGKLTIKNEKGAFNAKEGSKIDTYKDLTIENRGNGGLTTAGTVINRGTALVTNEKGNMTIGGTVNNTGDATFTNATGAGNFAVNGSVTNSDGLLTMTNNGTGAFTTGTNSHINAHGLAMTNNGSDFTTQGEIINVGQADITNNKGNFNLGGTVNNTGLGNYTNNGDNFTISANLTNNGNGNYINNGKDFDINGTVKNTQDTAKFTNNGTGNMTFGGTVENTGTTEVLNSDNSGKLTVGGNFTNNGVTTMTNNGTGFDVTGRVTNNNDKLTMLNNRGEFNVKADANVTANANLDMTNAIGTEAFTIDGTVNGKTVTNITNNGSGLTVGTNGRVNGTGTTNVVNNGQNGLTVNGLVSGNGITNITNNGEDGLIVNGAIDGTGTTTVSNTKGDLKVNNRGTITNRRGKLSLLNTNKNGGLYVYRGAKVHNEDNDTLISNNGAKGLNIEGEVENGRLLEITNEGSDAIRVSGTVHSVGDITMTNTGSKGIRIASTGQVNGDNDINVTNTSAKVSENNRTEGAVNVEGVINANNNLTINSTNGNLTLGHNNTANNLTAGKNIDLTVVDGSILNNGVEKTLINAGNNLTMDVTNGTIGEPVKQTGLTNSTGIGPKAQGARDFTKSINAKVAGNVKAKTEDVAKTGNDLVINYAAIDSNMNIDTIKADGRVILTVDDDFGNSNTPQGKHKYSMVNANNDGGTNVEGWGISLIADNNIGSKDNMITFIQTDAANHKMDALANNSIYLKENSFNAYGRDKEVKQNSVSTMIAREGDMYIEFAGNTKIDNITAEGDMTVITRGKNLEIENLGHIQDNYVTPADYFGPRHDGFEFDGRNDGTYKSDVLPNNVTVKALDINHNIRPTEELVDGNHEAWANSTVRIKNAVIDNGKMNIVADNVYANGIYAGFNKDGFTKKKDDSTNKVTGVVDPDSFNIPVGKAVRPDDVTGTGRGETERNYYYPNGDGDETIKGNTTTVDPDDGKVDGTPLVIINGNGGGDNPIIPNDPNIVPEKQDGKITWKKVDDNDVEAIDKRQYMRFGIASNEHPVTLEKTNNGIDQLLDVSRGGIAVTHSNKLKVGDVIPVHLTYADLDIKADVKVVTASQTRAGASFINLDKATANKLLYLNILLEDNTISFR